MKKIIVSALILILCVFIIPVMADILPLSNKSIKHYGIGVLNMPKSYTIYQYPRTDSNILREVNYENMKRSAIVNSVDMRKVSYVAYVPENNVALLTVDLNPGNDWYSVFIDQQSGETGWVYEKNEDNFYTYKRLFYKYGKPFGIRFFSDLDEGAKIIYSQPDKKSQKIEEVKYPKHITFTVIKGNWILANVNDIGKASKIGWIKWRNDDGTLNMFPHFKEQ